MPASPRVSDRPKSPSPSQLSFSSRLKIRSYSRFSKSSFNNTTQLRYLTQSILSASCILPAPLLPQAGWNLDHRFRHANKVDPASASFSILHSSDIFPVSNNTPLPSTVTSTVPCAPQNGLMLCSANFPPGSGSPMYRIVSLNYTIRRDHGEAGWWGRDGD